MPDERAYQASGYAPLVTLLTVTKSRWPYASNTAIYGRICSRHHVSEEWRSSLDSFAKVDGTVLPEPPMEEGLPFPLREKLSQPRGLLPRPST